MKAFRILNENCRFIGRRVITFFSVGLLFSVCLSASEIALGFLLQFVVTTKTFDYLTPYLPLSHEMALAIALVIVGFARLCFQYFAQIYSTEAQESLNARLRLLIIEDLIDSKEILGNVSDIQSNITENFQKGSQFVYYCTQLIGSSLQCLVLLVAMALSAPAESGIALGLFSIGVLLLLILNRRTKERSKVLPGIQLKLLSHVLRNARNQLLIRLYKTQGLEKFLTRGLVGENYNKYMESISIAYFSSSAAPLVGIIVLAAVYYSSSVYLGNDIPSLIVFFYLFSRFAQIASQSVQNLSYMSMFSRQYQNSRDAFDYVIGKGNVHLADIALECSRIRSKKKKSVKPINSEAVNKPAMAPEIRINSLGMKQRNGEFIFRNLNLVLKSGQHLGIEGPSGTGKSSLLAGILGLRAVAEGEVAINGCPAKSFLARDTVRIGYVGTDPFLMEGTIRSNLIYGLDTSPPETEIWEALESVNLSEVVSRLPAGLETSIGEIGPEFSTGQQQRLSFVRAILRRPHILILDEATSNLDELSESLIAGIVQEMHKKVTVVIVSHRKKLLENVDILLKLTSQSYMLEVRRKVE